MSNAAQKKAIENYRTRLTQRGFKRFEVLALEADREQSVACPASGRGGAGSGEARQTIKALVAGEPPKSGDILSALRRARLWSAPISTCRGRARKGAGSTCDALPPRYEHPQQHRQAAAVRIATGVVGGATRRKPVRRLVDHRRNSAWRSRKATRQERDALDAWFFRDRRGRKSCSPAAFSRSMTKRA